MPIFIPPKLEAMEVGIVCVLPILARKQKIQISREESYDYDTLNYFYKIKVFSKFLLIVLSPIIKVVQYVEKFGKNQS